VTDIIEVNLPVTAQHYRTYATENVYVIYLFRLRSCCLGLV